MKTVHEYYLELVSKNKGSGGAACKEMVGKVLLAPSKEYVPMQLTITDCSLNLDGRVKVSCDSPLRKSVVDPQFQVAQEVVIFKKSFFSSAAEDDIWQKFSVYEAALPALGKAQIARLNGIRGNKNCVSCKKPLVSMFGALLYCPECE